MYLRNPNKLPRHLRPLTRKTARKQTVRVRPKQPPIVLRFALPMTVSFALPPGIYNYNVEILDNAGNVMVRGWDRAQVREIAEKFLAQVAASVPPIERPATIEDERKPGRLQPWQLSFEYGSTLTLTKA